MAALWLAERLDDSAAFLYRKAGRTGDFIANAVITPVRFFIRVGCTRCARGLCRESDPLKEL